MTRSTTRPFAVLVSVAMLSFTACAADGDDTGGDASSEGAGSEGDGEQQPQASGIDLVFATDEPAGPVDEINWSLFEEPGTLDPDKLASTSIKTVNANICESLFQITPDFTLRPWLAASFERPNPTTFVYAIREGVTFHDGSTMTAEDVVWSLRRHANGVAAGDFENVQSIEQTGPMEVTMRLAEPDATQNLGLAAPEAGGVLNKEYVQRLGEDYGTAGSQDACTGPYALAEWDAGTSITLQRYEDYWNEDEAALAQTVTFTWGGPAAVTNSLQTGATDGAYVANNPGLVAALQPADQLGIYFGPASGSTKLIPTGSRVGPTLRKALSLAMDRKGLVNAAFQGVAQPWKAPVGPGAWGYARETFQASYDNIEDVPLSPTEETLQQARELVEQAEVPDGPIVVASDGSPLRNTIGAAAVSAGESIGLEVRVNAVGEAGYDQLFVSEDARDGIDFVSDDWDLSAPEPLSMYDSYAPGSGVNYIGYENEEYARILGEAVGTYDDAARADAVLQLQEIALTDMLWIPLAAAPNPLIMNDRLTGAPVSYTYRNYAWAADIGRAQN